MRLDGKVAIVTGAGSGIGEATARLMVQEGASVVVADINRSAAERVADTLRHAVAAEVDVADEASVVAMVSTAVREFGRLDVLHNNAADAGTSAADQDIVTLDMAVFDRLVAVNLKGVVMGCKHAIPRMLATGGGAIVNTASIDGFVGRGVRATYGATKAGIVMLTKAVAAQYGARGIRCNAVAPGLVLTPAVAGLTPEQRAASQADSAATVRAQRCGQGRRLPCIRRCLVRQWHDTDGRRGCHDLHAQPQCPEPRPWFSVASNALIEPARVSERRDAEHLERPHPRTPGRRVGAARPKPEGPVVDRGPSDGT